jgi:hypothetical protein
MEKYQNILMDRHFKRIINRSFVWRKKKWNTWFWFLLFHLLNYISKAHIQMVWNLVMVIVTYFGFINSILITNFIRLTPSLISPIYFDRMFEFIWYILLSQSILISPLSICNLCDEIRNLLNFLLCSKDFNIHQYFSSPKFVLNLL